MQIWRSYWGLWGAVCATTAFVAGCVGKISGGESDFGDGPARQVALPTVMRLSHWEWEQTIRELFGLDGVSISLVSDPLGGKAFDNNQSALRVGRSLWRDYQTAAETLAERVTSDPTLLARLAPEDPSTTAD